MGARQGVAIADAIRASLTEDIESIITKILKLTKHAPETVDVRTAAAMAAVKSLRLAHGQVSIAILNEKEA